MVTHVKVHNDRTSCYVLITVLLLANSVFANRPPKFLIDGQTEIVLRLKEGSDTPAGKFNSVYSLYYKQLYCMENMG